MTPFKTRRAISDGFSCRTAITLLSFKEVSTGGDIVLCFTTDGTEGLNGELARSFALSGIKFDEVEDWLRSFDLAAVALHEVGHVPRAWSLLGVELDDESLVRRNVPRTTSR